MKLIPEIRVKNGKIIDNGTGNLIEAVPLLRSLESGLSTKEEDAIFYIVDEDGIERNQFDIDLMGRLGEEFRIWLKAGFRRTEFLMDALILGAELAVMDSATVISLEEVKKAAKMSDNIAFSIEMRAYRRWNDVPEDMERLAEELNSINLQSIIFSCDSEKDIRAEIFKHPKFSHNCGEKEGFHGMIIPYNLIRLPEK